MGLHKRLDVGPVWPARRATHRGQCRPSCLLVVRSLFAPDPMLAGALDWLRRRQPGRRSRTGQVVPSGCGQLGCGPLKRPECDSGSEQVPQPPCHHGPWLLEVPWQPVGVPSPTQLLPSILPAALVLQALGRRGIQYCTGKHGPGLQSPGTMYCGDDEPRKSVDFGSQGRLGQRHMADRCIESKAVHINQSATGTQALMGWRLGT